MRDIRGKITLDALAGLVAEGAVETVVVAFPDLYGWLRAQGFRAPARRRLGRVPICSFLLGAGSAYVFFSARYVRDVLEADPAELVVE